MRDHYLRYVVRALFLLTKIRKIGAMMVLRNSVYSLEHTRPVALPNHGIMVP